MKSSSLHVNSGNHDPEVLLACFSLLIICSPVFAAEKDELLLSDPRHLDWFKEARFEMFIHWGLYSLLEGSYKGHTLPAPAFPQGKSWYAEWIQTRLEVPPSVYTDDAVYVLKISLK